MHLATLFLQDTTTLQGSVEKSYPPLSALTQSRMSYEDVIANSGDPEKAIEKIAEKNYDILCSYISHMGEVFPGNPIGALIQASLLRCKEIAYISEATGSSEIEALHILEDTETGALNTGDPLRDYILPSDVQAAIKNVIEKMKGIRRKQGKSTDISSVVYDCCGDCNPDNFSFFDFLGNVTQGDPLYNQEYWNDNSMHRANTYPDRVNYADGSFVDGLFGELKKLLDKVGQTAQSSVDDVASNSFREAIKRNLPLILVLALVLGVVIYAAVHYGNKKS